MNVQQITLQDMVLQATKGLDCTEGSNITLWNVKLLTADTDPVMNIHNSKDITLTKIGYKDAATLLLNISGDRSKGIKLIDTDASKAKNKVTFTYGATEKAFPLYGKTTQ